MPELVSGLTLTPEQQGRLADDLKRLLVINASWLRWNDSTPIRMAEAIRQDERYDDLPILADALEDAGCTNELLLRLLRERTRWVLKAISP